MKVPEHEATRNNDIAMGGGKVMCVARREVSSIGLEVVEISIEIGLTSQHKIGWIVVSVDVEHGKCPSGCEEAQPFFQNAMASLTRAFMEEKRGDDEVKRSRRQTRVLSICLDEVNAIDKSVVGNESEIFAHFQHLR